VRITRFLSLVDLTVICVVGVAIFVTLVPRPLYAIDAIKVDGDERWGLAVAEARALTRPDDGVAAAELSRRLREAKVLDWAVEVATQAAAAPESPSRWQAMLAAAVAYSDRVEVEEALAWASRAVETCTKARATCPSEDEVRMQLYASYLAAGLRSGIDPKKDPEGFRHAAQRTLRPIQLLEPRDHGNKP